ncbi:MAG: YopX family protein [Bacteroidota bacterium]
MEREIKFRVWDNASYMSKPFKLKDVNAWIEFADDAKVMQYTGLKDKNGVEIYEGDIIKYYNKHEYGIGTITFSAGFVVKWDLDTVVSETPTLETPLYYLQCSSEIEVIGNVHQNPELI